jgi:hypothetical protein
VIFSVHFWASGPHASRRSIALPREVNRAVHRRALDFSIRTARAQAWNNALLLSRFEPAQDELLIGTMDRTATVLARLIARPAGILRPALEVIRHAETSNVAAVIERLDHALDA